MFRFLDNGEVGSAESDPAAGTRAKVFLTSAQAVASARGGGRMGVEISGVTLCPGDDSVTAIYLDYPRTGPVGGYAFDAYGWVLGTASIAEVEFVDNEIIIARCDLEVQRPDVAEKFGGPTRVGFWKSIGTVGLEAAFTVGVRVVSHDGRRRGNAEIRGTQVRYEDLIHSPGQHIRAMLDALELSSSAEIIDAMVIAGSKIAANVNAHKTSPDAQSSVGRWKRDLDPLLQKICDTAFYGLLDELEGRSC